MTRSPRRTLARLAVAALGAAVLVRLAQGLDAEEAALAVAIVLALCAARRAVRQPRSRTAGPALLTAGALGAGYVVAVAALLLAHRAPDVAAASASAGRDLVDGRVAALGDEVSRALHVLAALVALGVVALVRALLAPRLPEDGHDAAEHTRAAAIVARHAHDSIAPFTLRADKAFFFAHGGVLAYRTLRETAVVSGDPVGPPGCAPAIVADFLAFAGRRGWDVVVVAARDDHLAAYEALGLRSLRIGSEAVVDPRGFDLSGRSRATVRKAVNRVQRHGWSVEAVPAAALTPAQAAGIAAVERAWRARRPRLYGYAMAMDRLWGAQEDAADLYVLARSPEGEVRAFQRYVPYREGLSLDAMRRLDDEPNGISDALVAAALAHARGLGCREVSLNFSAFAHLMAAESLERRSQRLARWALRRLHRRFQLERLARFAGKFGPQWRPRHLVYSGQLRLPVAALRVMQAEAYVAPPRGRPRPNAWRPRPEPPRAAVPGVAG